MEGIKKNIIYEKKLSIIVPVYNVEKYLERCVDSLLHQDIDKSEYEIILVNDGSTDSSYEIAKRLSQAHNNIILVSQKNQGQSVARNKGLNVAKGRYIMFVDSDDYIEENVIGKLIDISDNHSLDLCFFRNVFEYSDGSMIARKKQPFEEGVIYQGENLVLNNIEVSIVWLNLYSSEFLYSTGLRFLEGIIHEDVLFDYLLYPLAKRVMFTDIMVYHYCVYSESSIRTNNSVKVRKIIESDFHVAKNIKECSKNNIYSNNIRQHYALIGNSIAVSSLLQLCRNTCLDYQAKIDCIDTAKHLGTYPITGKTNSWKTTLLGYFINQEWLLRWVMKYYS